MLLYVCIFSHGRITSERQEYAALHRSKGNLEKFASNILPLLKQCWTEEYFSETNSTHASVAKGWYYDFDVVTLFTV